MCRRGRRSDLVRHDAAAAGAAPEDRQSEAGQHEDDGGTGGQFAQKSLAARGAENRLAGTGPEGRAGFRAFASLQQNDADQGHADEDMQDQKQCVHVFTIESELL